MTQEDLKELLNDIQCGNLSAEEAWDVIDGELEITEVAHVYALYLRDDK